VAYYRMVRVKQGHWAILGDAKRVPVLDSIFSPRTKPQEGLVRAMDFSFYGKLDMLLALWPKRDWH
jgi:hypothetical protein